MVRCSRGIGGEVGETESCCSLKVGDGWFVKVLLKVWFVKVKGGGEFWNLI